MEAVQWYLMADFAFMPSCSVAVKLYNDLEP